MFMEKKWALDLDRIEKVKIRYINCCKVRLR